MDAAQNRRQLLNKLDGRELPARCSLQGQALLLAQDQNFSPENPFLCSILTHFLFVHLLSHVWLFPTPRTAALQASLSSTISRSLLKFMSVELVMPPSHLISAAPFSFCLQSFPASGSFPVSQLFASGGQGTGASASAAVLPMNIHGWFSLGLTGLISLQSKGMATP